MFSTGNATADAVLGVTMMIVGTYCGIWIAALAIQFWNELHGGKGGK